MSRSKPWPEGFPGDPRKRRKDIIDDGFSAHLVAKSRFDGIMEIPVIEKPDEIVIPDGMTPFSKAHRAKDFSDFAVFYEHDLTFADVLTSTEEYLPLLSKFAGVVSPDSSLYRDMPLVLQIANTYMNRAVGSFLQSQGLYVVPNVRWGGERSFTTVELPEKIAFLGVERDSIVSIGTHGCCKAREDKYYLKAGLEAMLEETGLHTGASRDVSARAIPSCFDSVSRMSRDSDQGVRDYFSLSDRGVELVFLKERHIDTSVFKRAAERAVTLNVATGDTATDKFIASLTGAVNTLLHDIAVNQIRPAFEQSEKEVSDLRQRTREGMAVARARGKRIGNVEGSTRVTEKKRTAMPLIRKHSKRYGGTLSAEECMKLCGIGKNAYYRYCREIDAEIAGHASEGEREG